MVNGSETRTTTTLVEGLAQHYLPARPEAKPETEEERKARAEQVRIENRERKKKWREQNADRSTLLSLLPFVHRLHKPLHPPFRILDEPSLLLTTSNILQTKTTTSVAV